jgi:hypothetical protein
VIEVVRFRNRSEARAPAIDALSISTKEVRGLSPQAHLKRTRLLIPDIPPKTQAGPNGTMPCGRHPTA